MEIRVNDYLTWQSAQSSSVQTIIDESASMSCCPVPVRETLPNWWKKLPGNVNEATGCPVHNQQIIDNHGKRSARHCLGLRGDLSLGYSIQCNERIELDPHKNYWKKFYQAVKDFSWPDCSDAGMFESLPLHIQKECREAHGYDPHGSYNFPVTNLHTVELHPEMLHGSIWSEKNADDTYCWRIFVLSWPWRAKMSKGWRLLMTANPFHWSRSWHAFTGCVDENYRHDGYNINYFWNFDYPIDENFSYYNVETVIAIDSDYTLLDAGISVMNMIPVWDPDYQPKKFKDHPSYQTIGPKISNPSISCL